MKFLQTLVLCCLALIVSVTSQDCEVCVGVLNKFKTATDPFPSDYKEIETKLREFCKKAKNKEERFCWYIGATETSATGMVQMVSKPMSFHKPVEKICSDLKKKDAQICDLKYDKQIDLKTVNIKKLKVKELKKILEDNDESCKGCTEKSEYVKKVEAIAAKQGRTEL